MSELPNIPDASFEDPKQRQRLENAKNNALAAYIMMVLGMFTGIFWIIGAVWAMFKKEDAINTPYYDHYSNITKTFWWGLIWTVIGIVTWMFVVGVFICAVAWIWSIYRIIKGLAKITSDKPYNS